MTKLTLGELCAFKRMRRHETQKQIAAEMGRCRSWVNMMEVGQADASELSAYWDRREADEKLSNKKKGTSRRGKRAA